MGVTTAPVTGSGSWPTCTARVSKPSLTRSSGGAGGQELQDVLTGHDPDRVTAVEDEHRGGRVEAIDHVADRLADPDHRHRGLHELPDRPVEERRLVEGLVHELQLAERPHHLFRGE